MAQRLRLRTPIGVRGKRPAYQIVAILTCLDDKKWQLAGEIRALDTDFREELGRRTITSERGSVREAKDLACDAIKLVATTFLKINHRRLAGIVTEWIDDSD